MKFIFENAKILTGLPEESGNGHDCLAIEDSVVAHVGNVDDVEISKFTASLDVRRIDVGGRRLIPSFIDAHVHLLLFGISLSKIDLRACNSLSDIWRTIASAAEERPNATRLLCHGWRHAVTGNDVTASMLDGIDPRPIYIDADDYHSTWCSTAALGELDIGSTPDPVSGKIHRLPDGTPPGLIEEAAVVHIVWPFLTKALSEEERKNCLRAAIRTYNAAGYTGVVDMAMDVACWSLLHDLYKAGELDLRFAAHFIILPMTTDEENANQVSQVISLHKQFNLSTSPDFRVAGIKLICDGVVDACTAAISHPYLTSKQIVNPLWTPDALQKVLRQADDAKLQCALHAIGDAAVAMAVDGLASLGTSDCRHRIEHLELTRPEDARRLGKLGITASVQPVHCDPELYQIWPSLIGHDACSRAFAYGEFMDYGAKLAIGTDSPTAPHVAFNNLFNATTRRSFRRPTEAETVNLEFKLALNVALASTSYGAAYACFAEDITGGLRRGKRADFIIVDSPGDWERDPVTLLESKVVETWLNGRQVF